MCIWLRTYGFVCNDPRAFQKLGYMLSIIAWHINWGLVKVPPLCRWKCWCVVVVVVCTWSTSFMLTLIFVPDIEITLICAGQKRNQSKARCSDRSEQNEACRIICID